MISIFFSTRRRLLASTTALMASICLTGAAFAQIDNVKRMTIFEGKCRFEIVSGFFPCNPRVAYVELQNGRAFLTFFAEKYSWTLSGGRDRQPNLENFYQGLDTIRMLESGKKLVEDNGMEGECHFRLNRNATRFYSIKCDIYNRAKGSIYKFYLENITKFSKSDL